MLLEVPRHQAHAIRLRVPGSTSTRVRVLGSWETGWKSHPPALSVAHPMLHNHVIMLLPWHSGVALLASPEYFLHDLKESFKFLKVHLPKIPRCFHFSQICSSKRRSVWAMAKFSQQTPSMPCVVQVYNLRIEVIYRIVWVSILRHCCATQPHRRSQETWIEKEEFSANGLGISEATSL